jgi:putative addiction module CopG family antidote
MIQPLPPDLKEFVEQALATGKYRSADELICEGLRLLRERDRGLEELRRHVDAGLAQIDRGEVIVLDDDSSQRAFFEDIKARGRKRLEAR